MTKQQSKNIVFRWLVFLFKFIWIFILSSFVYKNNEVIGISKYISYIVIVVAVLWFLVRLIMLMRNTKHTKTFDFNKGKKVRSFILPALIVTLSGTNPFAKYVYEMPDLMSDFSIENMFKVIFWIPLFIVFEVIVPVFNYAFSQDTPSATALSSIIIMGFVLSLVYSYINPNFKIWGVKK